MFSSFELRMIKISLFALFTSFSLLSFSAQAQEILRVNGGNTMSRTNEKWTYWYYFAIWEGEFI